MTTDCSRKLPAWVGPAPLVVVCGLGLVVNLCAMALRISRPYPVNPWESGLMVEAYRIRHGLPIYTDITTGHATMMYGFLHPLWLMLATAAGGMSFPAMRLMSAEAAVVLAVLAVRVLARGLPMACSLIGVALMLGLNLATNGYFTDPRPNAMALLLSFVGVVLLWTGCQQVRWRLVAIGTAVLAAAACTLQTMTMFSAVPAGALLLRWRKPTRVEVGAAILPLAVVGGILALIKLAFPHASYYMFDVQTSYGMDWDGARLMALTMVGLATLPLVSFAVWSARREAETDPIVPWLLSGVAVSIPCAIITAGPTKDVYRLLPALVACTCFFIYGLRWLWPLLTSVDVRPLRRLGLGVLLGMLAAATMMPDPATDWYWAADVRFGDDGYAQVVEAVRGLRGMVLSPNDPSITLRARGEPGRSMVFEWDAVHWRPHPDYIDSYLRAADWIVLVETTWRDGVDRTKLAKLGFAPVNDWPARNHVYSLWMRVGPLRP